MNPLEHIIRLFAPHTCIGCGIEEDALLCQGCAASLPLVPSRCYHCKAVTEEYAVCRACAPRTPLRQVLVYTHYQDAAKELIHRTKYERARAGAQEMAAQMNPLLPYVSPNAILVPVPTATSRVRQRGYDQAVLLARALTRQHGHKTQNMLARIGQAHQVGARRAERLRQVHDAFRPLRHADIRGRHIVLVDDVLTTGATLEAAARTLRNAGAARVSAIVYAQP